MIFAGNKYLANYASYYNTCVKIVPTTIDTEEYKRDFTVKYESDINEKVCIGWTGSITTIKHFEYALPFLKTLKKNMVTGLQ
jgi:glycosyltransferase involved in cell wall biosynthesis